MTRILLTILTAGFLSQCTKDQLYCTEEFRTIFVEIVDTAGNPFFVDDYTVTRVKDNALILSMGTNSHQDTGTNMVVLFTDSQMDFTTESGMDFRLELFKDGALLTERNYKIRHDKCHVILSHGASVIVL